MLVVAECSAALRWVWLLLLLLNSRVCIDDRAVVVRLQLEVSEAVIHYRSRDPQVLHGTVSLTHMCNTQR